MNARIAVGRLRRIAHRREIGGLGAGEKRDNREPDTAVQQFIDRGMVVIGHRPTRAPRRNSTSPGPASSISISAAEIGNTSARWRSAKTATSPTHHATATQRSHARLVIHALAKNAMPM